MYKASLKARMPVVRNMDHTLFSFDVELILHAEPPNKVIKAQGRTKSINTTNVAATSISMFAAMKESKKLLPGLFIKAAMTKLINIHRTIPASILDIIPHYSPFPRASL